MRIGGVKIGGTMWVVLGVGVAAIVAGVMISRRGNSVVPQAGPIGQSTVNGPAAEPWAYDSVTKRHYDPGHGHWHDGPPPPLAARGLAAPTAPMAGAAPAANAGDTMSGPPPAAWTHDVAGNRHWDPTHNHWHPGPPPPGAR
jgi:hypothetical protein